MISSKRTVTLVFVLMLVLCVAVSGWALAGKGGKGKPQPPACECPEVIELPNGTVCTLDQCGFDCTYVCPLPF